MMVSPAPESQDSPKRNSSLSPTGSGSPWYMESPGHAFWKLLLPTLTPSTDRLGLECGSGQKGLQSVKGQESFPGGSDP